MREMIATGLANVKIPRREIRNPQDFEGRGEGRGTQIIVAGQRVVAAMVSSSNALVCLRIGRLA